MVKEVMEEFECPHCDGCGFEVERRFKCEMCGMSSEFESSAELCEVNHIKAEDRYFQQYERKVSFEKLKAAAKAPGQKVLA